MCLEFFKRPQSVKDSVSHKVSANCKGYTGEARANAEVLKRKTETFCQFTVCQFLVSFFLFLKNYWNLLYVKHLA